MRENFDEKGTPNRWKIENSWGEEAGKKGYFVCSEAYFKEYVYEVSRCINGAKLTLASRKMSEARQKTDSNREDEIRICGRR